MCCGNGAACCISNLFPSPIPEPLNSWLSRPNSSPEAQQFLKNIRVYNNLFSMASSGMDAANPPDGNSMIAIKGKVYHRMGSAWPAEGDIPRFAQLWIIDGAEEQVNARLATAGLRESSLHRGIVSQLQEMLGRSNNLVSQYVMALDLPPEEGTT
jgi:hypothetical protein